MDKYLAHISAFSRTRFDYYNENHMFRCLRLIDAQKYIYRAIFPLPNNWRDMELFIDNYPADPQDVRFDSYSDNELLALISEKIVQHSKDVHHFWKAAGTSLLWACVFYLRTQCAPSEQNFYNVLKLIRCGWLPEHLQCEQTSLFQIFSAIEETDPENMGVLNYKCFRAAGEGQIALDILTFCECQLMEYISQSFEK